MANITGSIADAGRLIHLAKRREREKEDMEKMKKKAEVDANAVESFGDKFKSHYDAIETQLKTNTVGLVTLQQMKDVQESYIAQREKELAHKKLDAELRREADRLEEERRRKAEQQKKRVLSFDPEDEYDDEDDDSDVDDASKSTGSAAPPAEKKLRPADDAESSLVKSEDPADADVQVVATSSGIQQSGDRNRKSKLGKDPTVDTSFLPDKEREEEENKLREELRREWALRQEEVKNEEIDIAYSYWDGSGHRRDTKMKKGQTIGQFLHKAIEELRPDFAELKTFSADSLMFVKEDLIIPHFHTFYDFIVTKAMGKTGPLFEFDALGELRIRSDAKQTGGESHPGKVVLRHWYEKNKHIYPSSRWEPFVPNRKYDRTTEDLSQL